MKPKDLGFTPEYMYMVRHGKIKVSDALLCAALRYVTP